MPVCDLVRSNLVVKLLTKIGSCTILNSFLDLLLPKNYNLSIITELTLSSNFQFKILSDIVTYDTLNNKFRFGLTYLLLSPIYNCRLKVTTMVKDKSPEINSIRYMHFSAGWLERES